MKGIMIDLSRCCEKPAYYHHLIDLLAENGLDTLVLHCCDDQGFGITLDGFEEVAHPWALTVDDVEALKHHAAEKGIQLIPEIEPFGHTLWVSRMPAYAHIFLTDQKEPDLKFNAVDPRHPDTHELMQRLLDRVCELFPGTPIHIGCDEVDLDGAYDDPTGVWAAYVNQIISWCIDDHGRDCMLWADHLVKEPAIASAIDKRAMPIHWQYGPWSDPEPACRLRDLGFSSVAVAPAASCWRSRLHTNRDNLSNIRHFARYAGEHGFGFLCTIWCPHRHPQRALDVGIAYAGAAIASGGALAGSALDRHLAATLFASDDERLLCLLRDLPHVVCSNDLCTIAYWRHHDDPTITKPVHREQSRQTIAIGSALLTQIEGLTVAKNQASLDALRLSIRASVAIAGCVLDPDWPQLHPTDYRQLIADLEADWDATRATNDPIRDGFPWGSEHHFLLPMLKDIGHQVLERPCVGRYDAG